MKRYFVMVLLCMLGCNYDNLQDIEKQSLASSSKSSWFSGWWFEIKSATAGCVDSTWNRATAPSGFGAAVWHVGKDSLGLTYHGTLTIPYSFTIDGNTLCLRNSAFVTCYTFIHVGDTLTLISRPGVPKENCVTERVLVKEH
jgi:hypothetical protein